MTNPVRKFQFHTIPPVDICLDIWAESMGKSDRDLGIQTQQSLSNGDGYGNDYTAEARRDNEIAEATDAMITGLATHHRWAINKCKGICLVWNFPRLDYAATLTEAKKQLEEKLRKNVYTRILF